MPYSGEFICSPLATGVGGMVGCRVLVGRTAVAVGGAGSGVGLLINTTVAVAGTEVEVGSTAGPGDVKVGSGVRVATVVACSAGAVHDTNHTRPISPRRIKTVIL